MTRRRHLLYGLTGLLLLSACNTTRHVQPGQYLLRSVKIQVDSLSPSEQRELGELRNYLPLQPNARLLGVFDWTLGIYNLSKPGSNNFINRLLRRIGSAPVLYNEQEAEFGRANLTAALYNLGYLNAETQLQVDTAGRKARLHYHIIPGPRFTIGHHEEAISDSTLHPLLHPTDTLLQRRLYYGEQYSSLLRPGQKLSPKAMRAEQERIALILRNRGYYTFTGDSIRFDVDTLAHQDVWVRSRINSSQSVYRIGRVRLLHQGRSEPSDTTLYRDTTHNGIDYRLERLHYLRPSELDHRIWIRPGDLYSQQSTARTYSSLSDLASLRSVSIRYQPDTVSKEPVLNADILTTAERSKSLSGDIVGTNSSGSLGASASLTFLHNNLFAGGEQWRLQLRGGYESFRGKASDHRSYGLETSLSFPKLLIPFLHTSGPSTIRSTTDLQLSYDHHSRPEFSRNILSFDWGYSWYSHYSSAYRHQLKVVDLDYLHFGYINEDFRRLLPLITQILNYRDQFVFGASYLFRYNSLNDYRLNTSPWVHNLRLYLQSAGNVLYGLSHLLGQEKAGSGEYELFGTNYAQFVKAEIDYSGLRRLGEGNAFAYRLGLGAAIPYGNSRFVPVDLRYFVGGANSIRGWSARSLGPGSMPRSASRTIFDQVGDLKLELSAEYRMRALRDIQLAFFADAGNIWTIRDYENQPQGVFDVKRFYREIALSSGMGLRWDFNYFVLRFDAGLKLYDPQVENGRPWVIGYQSPHELLAFHFAIGYPF